MEISTTTPAAEMARSVWTTEAKTPEMRAESRELIRAVKKLNESGKPEMKFGKDSELTFLLDRETGKPVVRIIDKRTHEVIQQIPPEYVLRMADELELRR